MTKIEKLSAAIVDSILRELDGRANPDIYRNTLVMRVRNELGILEEEDIEETEEDPETGDEVRKQLHKELDTWFDRLVAGDGHDHSDTLKFLYIQECFENNRAGEKMKILPVVHVETTQGKQYPKEY